MTFFLLGLAPFIIAAGVLIVATTIEFDKDERPYSLCPPNRSATEPTRPSTMGEEAASYRGRGPHHIIVDEFPDPDLGPEALGIGIEESLPESWVVPRSDESGYQFDTLKLVVCVYQYAVGDDGQLGTCSQKSTSGEVYTTTTLTAKYDFRVYEAATGKVLTSFTADGKEPYCPDTGLVYPDQPRQSRHPAEPDYAEVENLLKPLVERDVP